MAGLTLIPCSLAGVVSPNTLSLRHSKLHRRSGNAAVVLACRSSAAASTSNAKPDAAQTKPSSRGAGLKKPLNISPALQKFLGVQQASRADTMKLVWDYIKSNQLQSKNDKRIIVCDEKLKDVLGKDEVNFLEVAKLLNPHFLKTSS